jgi:succinate dehydrogenase/fumarate reductase flavoprotein subunit
MKTDYDVIVVGGGGSGLAAAVGASEGGCRVLVLEKRPELGGTTGIAVGSFTANRTVYQRRAGIEDRVEDHEADAGQFGPAAIQARNNSVFRQFFLEHAAETLDWLMGMGLHFHGPSPEPPNRVPRMHNVVPNAKAYIAVLQSRLLRRGGTILCRAQVSGLTWNGEPPRVSGVEADVEGTGAVVFSAQRGVVLAAGDYANSPQLITRYKGSQFAGIEGINPYSTGDGHRIAEQAGAELTNMDVTYGPELRFIPPPRKPFSQLLPGSGPAAWLLGALLPLVPKAMIHRMIKRLLVTWQHPEDALFADGAVLVNQRGERFCSEVDSPDREIAIAQQPGKWAYLLMDGVLAERYSRWPHFVSTAPEIAYAYVDDYRRMRPDITVVAEQLEPLAARRGLPLETLRATVAATETLRRGPWVLLGPVKAYFTTTEGGAMVDTSMRVLNAAGAPIPGLYAVGQNGLSGMVLWGHGLHIAWALTSGRLAGRALSQQTP